MTMATCISILCFLNMMESSLVNAHLRSQAGHYHQREDYQFYSQHDRFLRRDDFEEDENATDAFFFAYDHKEVLLGEGTGDHFCGSMPPNSTELVKSEALTRRFRESQRNGDNRRLAPCNGCIVIDTYFHVITDSAGSLGSVLDATINDQIAVLNSAFAGSPFQFALQGITRTADSSLFYLQTSYNNYVPSLQADLGNLLRQGDRKTLNIYTAKFRPKGLGVATFPSAFVGVRDGVILDYCSLPGGSCPPYNTGEIPAHEVGHWLGLLHVFEGGCNEEKGDYVSDTPAQNAATYACSDPPDDSCPGSGPDPLDNYMGYSTACFGRFTPGQWERMYDQWLIYRDGSGGCDTNEGILSIEIKLDSTPQDNYWRLYHDDGQLITMSDFGASQQGLEFTAQICLPYGSALYFGLGDATANGLAAGPDTKCEVYFDGKTLKDDRTFEKWAGAAFTMVNDAGCPPDEGFVVIELLLDDYPEETTWWIEDGQGSAIYTEGEYKLRGDPLFYKHASVRRELCLPPGGYSFIIQDSYGDGLGEPGPGDTPFFRISANDQVIIDETSFFTNEQTASFSVEQSLLLVAPPPTLTPSTSPSQEPSHIPSNAPSELPTVVASAVPSASPSDTPSISPSQGPTVMASSMPSVSPSMLPSHTPSLSPSYLPSHSPSIAPSRTPSDSPSQWPSQSPSVAPSQTPTMVESMTPSATPSMQPTRTPSQSPSGLPSHSPSITPSRAPSESPSQRPSQSPSAGPSQLPTMEESMTPSATPSWQPSKAPSQSPSDLPSYSPSSGPSGVPSGGPSQFPTIVDSTVPSLSPTTMPSWSPSISPSQMPTTVASSFPSSVPSRLPSQFPSSAPSLAPTIVASTVPSALPSDLPSHIPSAMPSDSPTMVASNVPSSTSTVVPSQSPSIAPSEMPTTVESAVPSSSPTFVPSHTPSISPSQSPSFIESTRPSATLRNEPSQSPSIAPSQSPSNVSSNSPSLSPTMVPSQSPSVAPSQEPSVVESAVPSAFSSSVPSLSPSIAPSELPTAVESTVPSSSPTLVPSQSASISPSQSPTTFPSRAPSVLPTMMPSQSPSISPSQPPSVAVSTMPSSSPSFILSQSPSIAPSHSPTVVASTAPSLSSSVVLSQSPSNAPSSSPSTAESGVPSSSPTMVPSQLPSTSPSQSPTIVVSAVPSSSPTLIPSQSPSHSPTLASSTAPSSSPTLMPSQSPSLASSQSPTVLVSMVPSSSPTFLPSQSPSIVPSQSPTVVASTVPSSTPTLVPSLSPSISPSQVPTAVPSTVPSQAPSMVPSHSPSSMPSDSPSMNSFLLLSAPSSSPSAGCPDLMNEEYFYKAEIQVMSVTCTDSGDISKIGDVIVDKVKIPYTLLDTIGAREDDSNICADDFTNQPCTSSRGTYTWRGGGICGATFPDPKCNRSSPRRLAIGTQKDSVSPLMDKLESLATKYQKVEIAMKQKVKARKRKYEDEKKERKVKYELDKVNLETEGKAIKERQELEWKRLQNDYSDSDDEKYAEAQMKEKHKVEWEEFETRSTQLKPDYYTDLELLKESFSLEYAALEKEEIVLKESNDKAVQDALFLEAKEMASHLKTVPQILNEALERLKAERKEKEEAIKQTRKDNKTKFKEDKDTRKAKYYADKANLETEKDKIKDRQEIEWKMLQNAYPDSDGEKSAEYQMRKDHEVELAEIDTRIAQLESEYDADVDLMSQSFSLEDAVLEEEEAVRLEWTAREEQTVQNLLAEDSSVMESMAFFPMGSRLEEYEWGLEAELSSALFAELGGVCFASEPTVNVILTEVYTAEASMEDANACPLNR